MRFDLQHVGHIGSQRTSYPWVGATMDRQASLHLTPYQDLPRTTPSQDRELQRTEGTEKPLKPIHLRSHQGTHTAECLAAVSVLAKEMRQRFLPERCADISHPAVNKLPAPAGGGKGLPVPHTPSGKDLSCGGLTRSDDLRTKLSLLRVGLTLVAALDPHNIRKLTCSQ